MKYVCLFLLPTNFICVSRNTLRLTSKYNIDLKNLLKFFYATNSNMIGGTKRTGGDEICQLYSYLQRLLIDSHCT